MPFFELAKNRYSVRKFKDTGISDEQINFILEAGRIAPTAHNAQPQRIKVITGQDELRMVDICTPCRFSAPLVLLICYDKNESWKRSFDNADSGEVDASIITTHMMMQAQDMGLGSCWVMYFDPLKTRELFSLSENLEPVSFLPIGYASEDAVPSEAHSKRKEMKDFLI